MWNLVIIFHSVTRCFPKPHLKSVLVKILVKFSILKLPVKDACCGLIPSSLQKGTHKLLWLEHSVFSVLFVFLSWFDGLRVLWSSSLFVVPGLGPSMPMVDDLTPTAPCCNFQNQGFYQGKIYFSSATMSTFSKSALKCCSFCGSKLLNLHPVFPKYFLRGCMVLVKMVFLFQGGA